MTPVALVHGGKRPPTANRQRGKQHRYEIAADTDEWRHAFWARAREAQVPRFECVEFEIVPLHKDFRSPQDVGACSPAGKAAIDGIICAMDGLPYNSPKVDDGPHRVLGVTYRPPACGCGVDGLRVVVIPVDGGEAPVAVRTLLVPVSPAVERRLVQIVGTMDARRWGVEAGRLLEGGATG